MAKLIQGTFTQYELSQREQLAGMILTTDQQNYLQNELAQVANQLVNLDFDPESPLKFAQSEAFLRGQMSVYRVMLDRSNESAQQLQHLPSSL